MTLATNDKVPLKQSEPSPGVRLITLSLPHLRNAMTAELTAAWVEAFAGLQQDPAIRVVVVTGEGSAFCSGADLSWLDQGESDVGPAELRDRMLPFYAGWLAPRELSVPVVAAVNGPAIGAGLALALACDLRYAATDASFRVPFLQLGTHGGMAAQWLLAEAIGASRARELLFTGRELSAAEALQWGLVNGVSDDVVSTALAVAEKVAECGPVATKLTKAGVNQLPMTFQAAVQWDALSQSVTLATRDIHEGIRAIREQREPRFKGR